MQHQVWLLDILFSELASICATVATATRIVLIAVLVADLATRLATSVLPAFGKAFVQVRPDDALVELGTSNVLHAVQSIVVSVILHKAEPAGGLLKAVETHDETLDLSTFGEEFVNLFFGGVEGQVPDVERGRVLQLLLRIGGGFTRAVVVPFAVVASSLILILRETISNPSSPESG